MAAGGEDIDDRELLSRAFAVDKHADDEFDMDIPPTSGMEYLRRVQMEARHCPQVLVADIDVTKYEGKQVKPLRQVSSLHPAPAGFAPSAAWHKHQSSTFSVVRQKMASYKARMKRENVKCRLKLPHKELEGTWRSLCLSSQLEQQACSDPLPAASPAANPAASPAAQEEPGNEDSESSGESESEVSTDQPPLRASQPLLGILTFLEQATVAKLLEYQLKWLRQSGFSAEQGRWIYALLVVLEKPLTPEVCSTLRSLARDCASLRATLDTHESPQLPPLNLFISLVGHYFGQADLLDGCS